ncbi:MAG: LacI family transcriptional regulator [Gammaproteobacteria bacterium]|nr:LacI family transcriptional regulator [Gammaproteobacteria bacterium]
MATIYEVSKLAGVSLATVSRVMNNSGKVRDATRRKVLDAMEQLDYQPNSFAQSLASNRSNCVGVLVSEMHGPIFGEMLTAIDTELHRSGKFALIAGGHNDEEKEAEAIRFLSSRNCDALILHVEALSNEFLLSMLDRLPPFVMINREIEGMADRCISLDNEHGGYLATHSLLEQGHTHIAYISGPQEWADASARLAGHNRALTEFGLELDERLVFEGDYLVPTGSRLAAAILDLELPVTAIVCANDEMAVGAMEVLRSRKHAIPSDISLVGYDNVRWSSFLNPKLTTVNYPVADMSRMAVNWVLKQAYGEEGLPVRNVFEPELIRRESSGPAPVADRMANL